MSCLLGAPSSRFPTATAAGTIPSHYSRKPVLTCIPPHPFCRSAVELADSLAARLPPKLLQLIRDAAAAPAAAASTAAAAASSSTLPRQSMGDTSSAATLSHAPYALRKQQTAAEATGPVSSRRLGATAAASSSSSLMSFSAFATAAKNIPEFSMEAARQVHLDPKP